MGKISKALDKSQQLNRDFTEVPEHENTAPVQERTEQPVQKRAASQNREQTAAPKREKTSDAPPRKTPEKPEASVTKIPARANDDAASAPVARLGGNIVSSSWDERLTLTTEAKSPVAETFNRLRSQILHHSSSEKPPRTILVTSSAPQEGKGFVCANLGIALARGMSNHALLVDCDLRKPSLAGLFGQPDDYGLSDYLQNRAKLPDLIRKSGMRKLSFIAGGPTPINPSELLDSQKMIVLIKELTSRYDDRFIIFDTPPSVVASETAVLSKYVDGVLIVVRWGHSDRQEIKELVDMIGKDKILGIVFNAYEKNRLEKFMEYKKPYGTYLSDYS